ncbi:uncharacterized protein ATC70_006273 [Mucor velutinosus]|uniref:Uncharacterized protein n=1 Tax=Mucor velutinosus TaxID=708070 RepID=A0AAN7D4C1_9FUNG|nr:hypothetical protein ATC70_006273 [Mucor velutinosus]
MKRPHSPTRMPSRHGDPPAPDCRRSTSPPPNSFDGMCVRNDFRQTKKDLLEVIVDLDKTEHSISSLKGQLKTAKDPLKAQLDSQRVSLNMKISKQKKAYNKLKNRVYLIDKEMKFLSRRSQQDIEDGEISSVQVKLEEEEEEEEEYGDSGPQQREKKRM